jgi:hypothetical protein
LHQLPPPPGANLPSDSHLWIELVLPSCSPILLKKKHIR